MSKKSWNVYGDRRTHLVELEHGYWSGRRIIKVDGRVVLETRKLNDTGTEHDLNVGNRKVNVVIRCLGLTYAYDLVVDGISVETGSAAPVVAMGDMPKWSWAFVGVCGLIPIITLGGLFPAAIGGGGASICYSIARNPTMGTGQKALLLAGTTAATWTVFGIFLLIVGAVLFGQG